jgi:membrane associated rhomboid family serine protease
MATNKESVVNVVIRRAPITLIFIGLFAVISLFPLLFGRDAVIYFALRSTDLGQVSNWYKLITYAWIHVNLSHFVIYSLAILISGLIVEPRLKKAYYVSLVLSSGIVGALIFSALVKVNMPLVGSGCIVSAVQGAVLACWLRMGKTFHKIERIYAYILIAGLLLGIMYCFYWIVMSYNPALLSHNLRKSLMFLYGFLFMFRAPMRAWEKEGAKDIP